MPWLSGSTSW